MTSGGAPDVLIVGGGAIGVACALELAQRGVATVLVERGPTVGTGCSYGSAGLISPRHATPLATPQALRQGVRWMFDRSSPFALGLQPRLVPWLSRFVLASTTAHAHRSAAVLRELTMKGLEFHAEYARSGMETGFQRRGSVSVYETEGEFQAGRREAELHSSKQFPNRVLDEHQLRELSLSLGQNVVGAIHFAQDAHCDSFRFVVAVAAAAERAGADVRTGVEVRRLLKSGNRIVGIETSAGTLHAGEIVLAAGAWAGHLARQVGVFIPLEGGKGYHIDLALSPGDPQVPVFMEEARVVATPLVGRLRLAGTLEMTGFDARINPSRLAAVRLAGERNLSGLSGREVVETWSGLRPCTPDGLPVIGRPPSVENLVVATGHAMKGVAHAPITGMLVSELVRREQSTVDMAPLRPDRFSTLRRWVARRTLLGERQ